MAPKTAHNAGASRLFAERLTVSSFICGSGGVWAYGLLDSTVRFHTTDERFTRSLTARNGSTPEDGARYAVRPRSAESGRQIRVVQDLGATYEFLVSDRSTKGGALYFPAAYRRQGIVVPFSFQLLLGHSKLESTVRYPGIEVDDALEMAEQTEV
jgi:hypothetical protein